MKVKLTLASKEDKKPTISALEIGCNEEIIIVTMQFSEKSLSVSFHKSRDGRTYYADSWDKRMPLPKVGKPIDFELINVRKLVQLNLFES